jgi:hypothetical protein
MRVKDPIKLNIASKVSLKMGIKRVIVNLAFMTDLIN